MEKRTVQIDYMYIDLDTCDRCIGTEKNLYEAIEDVSKILKETGVEVIVNKIHVKTEEQASELGFVSSPTIRINGKDVQLDVKETLCDCCSDICGDEVDCRIWVYQGKEYDVAPKAMIIEAIMKVVYGGSKQQEKDNQRDIKDVPENLRRFFKSVNEKDNKEKGNGCCGSGSKCNCGC